MFVGRPLSLAHINRALSTSTMTSRSLLRQNFQPHLIYRVQCCTDLYKKLGYLHLRDNTNLHLCLETDVCFHDSISFVRMSRTGSAQSGYLNLGLKSQQSIYHNHFQFVRLMQSHQSHQLPQDVLNHMGAKALS